MTRTKTTKKRRERVAKLLLDIDTKDIKITLNPELPKPVSMDEVVQDEIAKTETICEKARRLAWEERKQEREKAMKIKQDFLSSFGLTADEDDDHEYELCGYKWKCKRVNYYDPSSMYWLRLANPSTYDSPVYNLLSLGHVVIALDEEKAKASMDALRRYATPSAPWWKRVWRRLFS